ncbi:MAG: phosphate ABC transporter substrate-binding protein [Candidatus Fermentithermobacillus carboniphilus]|uniref:Phosphate-binding protein n=1 Tax=Candidatus Fermentithermobacillus carboniphilus TaxID=3085328 RepID=A0AAT9LCV6_9FIRM|nr:MAG: phosphate ABC transporter substrate-binding protein [Candidatus Fermentithermobacillus carboniphilus]
MLCFLILLASFMVSACSRASRPSSSITVAGSTSVQPFMELLAEEYARLYPEKPAINVQGGGSSAGARSVLSGAASIGMLSRELAPEEKGLDALVIARDAIAVIVNPKNPIRELSIRDLRAIFSGEITDWGQLIGAGERGDFRGRIHVVSREEGSGTRGAFDEMIMEGREVTARAIFQDSNGSVKETVAQDPMAIGYISLGLVDRNVKPLSIDGVAPTIENCKSGKYALVRPFLVVTKGEVRPEVREFLDFIMGETGQKILREEGLITGGQGATALEAKSK